MGSDPRFEQLRVRPAVSVAKLDELMAFVLDSGTGRLGAFIAGVKLLAVVGYVFARDRLRASEAELLKQEYEQSGVVGSRNELRQDNLESELRQESALGKVPGALNSRIKGT